MINNNNKLLRERYPKFFENPIDPSKLSEEELNKIGWYKKIKTIK